MVKPRSYWLHQEHPGIYQELAHQNQELRLEVPAYEYCFAPLQINTDIKPQLSAATKHIQDFNLSKTMSSLVFNFDFQTKISYLKPRTSSPHLDFLVKLKISWPTRNFLV